MKTQAPSAHGSHADLLYTLRAGAYREGELHVLSFEGREEMNGLFAFDVVAWCKDIDEGALEAAVIGQPALLTMHLADGASRCVRGIVSSLIFEGRREGGRHALRLTIVPRALLLQKRVNSRIFQDKTVQQIAEVLLEEHGISRGFHLLSKYPSRQYCVQYQESDYQFLSRIVAEEGIFFYFEHPDEDAGDDPERLIFADSAHSYPPIPGDRVLVYRPQQGEGAMHAEENQVQDFRARARVESNAVAMRDYDFRRPLLDLESGAGVDGKPVLEVYDHHGEYEETDADTGNAAVLLEQLRRGAREAHGRSVCRRLVPGHVLTLADHDAERLNTAHVVTSVEHRGVTPEAAQGSTRLYDNRFHCVLAEVPFRPVRPARQLHQVTESAVVVGPEGQEIFTDAFGRIKVQFHWDREGQRNAQSSCWMRVAQAWAGSGWGFQFIPRIGMEVLVSFLGGDQDRPVVVGCLYNAQNPPPHPLPGNATRSGIRTRSTPGGAGANEIAFEDRAGNEQLFVRAQRNLDEEVGLDRSEKVARDATETVGANLRTRVGQHRDDETEGDHRVTVQGGRSVTVAGRDSVQVGGPRTTTIGGLDSTHVDGARILEVDGPRTVRLGGNDMLFIKG
ncbi:MAG: type VI secretion system tip protein TssI/VgrG, partial [Minicystis sp.]